jgi:hypothetical protein
VQSCLSSEIEIQNLYWAYSNVRQSLDTSTKKPFTALSWRIG